MTLYHGDTLDVLPHIESASVDAIISDPPYPEIDRAYGRLTEFQWSILMKVVCHQSRRILKPGGSAVFVLQPNSRKVGSMRGWLFEFQAWVCREWNMVQDVWWWNPIVLPSSGATNHSLLRGSVKSCVWAGEPSCYRNQGAILWMESERNAAYRQTYRAGRQYSISGHSVNQKKCADSALKRGGVTPFNLVPLTHGAGQTSSGALGHGAGTPLSLADWWTRYIVPDNGVILDPFVGAGTMMLAGLLRGHTVIGVDKECEYLDITIERCESAEKQRRGEWHIRPGHSKPKPAPEGQLELFK